MGMNKIKISILLILKNKINEYLLSNRCPCQESYWNDVTIIIVPGLNQYKVGKLLMNCCYFFECQFVKINNCGTVEDQLESW